MVSESVIEALQDEMGRLRAEADVIDDFLKRLSGRPGLASPVQQEQAPAETQNGTFSSKIRDALRDIGDTATARQVADQMIRSGSPPERNGKPLRERISVELFRMSERGTGGVRKVKRGYYKIETEDSEE